MARVNIGGIVVDVPDSQASKHTPVGAYLSVPAAVPSSNSVSYGMQPPASAPSSADQVKALLSAQLQNQQNQFTQALPNQQQQPLAQQQQQAYIERLNEAKKAQTLAALDKSRQAALSNLSSEKSAIQPKYYDQRNQVAAGSQQQARNFAEFMANRGGTRSGVAAQAELSRTGTLQGNLGTLGRQEAQAYQDIERRTSGIQNAYQSDVAAAEAGMQAERMQTLINQMNQDKQFGLQEAGLTGQYQGGQTLAARTADQIYGLNLAGLSGQLPGGGQTLANRQFGLQAQGQAFNQNMATQQFDFQKAQQDWDNTFRSGQFDFQKAQQLWENTFKDKSFQQSVSQFAQQLGMDAARMNQSQQQFAAEMAFKQKAFDADQTQKKLDNEFRQIKTDLDAPDIKDDLNVMYQAFSDGSLDPKDALKMIEDKVKIGAEDPANGEKLKKAIFILHPEMDPSKKSEPYKDKNTVYQWFKKTFGLYDRNKYTIDSNGNKVPIQ